MFRETTDFEKDPHFVRARAKNQNRLYKDAQILFEKALRANPNNWAAHKDLGIMYYNNNTKSEDWPAAIYHFRKFIALNPRHGLADDAKGYIDSLIVKIAQDVNLGSIDQSVHAQLLAYQNQNEELKKQVERLKLQLAQQGTSPTPSPRGSERIRSQVNSGSPLSQTPPTNTSRSGTQQAADRPKYHNVKAGETFYSIAKKFGVSSRDLQRANPSARPTRLPIGKKLRIPAR
jgi:LysM repeat protein